MYCSTGCGGYKNDSTKTSLTSFQLPVLDFSKGQMETVRALDRQESIRERVKEQRKSKFSD